MFWPRDTRNVIFCFIFYMKSTLDLNPTSYDWRRILMFIFIWVFICMGSCKDLCSDVCLGKWRKDLTLSPWWSPSLVSFHLFLHASVETCSFMSVRLWFYTCLWWCHQDPSLQAWPWCFAVSQFLFTYLLLPHTHSHNISSSRNLTLRNKTSLSSSCCTSVHLSFA